MRDELREHIRSEAWHSILDNVDRELRIKVTNITDRNFIRIWMTSRGNIWDQVLNDLSEISDEYQD